MRKLSILLALAISPIHWVFGQNSQVKALAPVSAGEIVSHNYYSLAYSEEHEQAYWVFYRLTPDFINSNITRTDDFRPDQAVSTGSALLSDYKGSGFDRGHLCPAADMKLNKTSMSETFFLSNMSPQVPAFNQGIWNNLEELVRDFCISEDTLFVATGPVFKNNQGSIGASQVTIPGFYYKALYDPTSTEKMIAFVLPNAKSSAAFAGFVITVDSLEVLTGMDFFPGLPDPLEKGLESQSDLSQWKIPSVASACKSNSTIKIFPNPAIHHFNLTGLSGKAHIEITDARGRLVLSKTIDKNESIGISHLSRGIYALSVRPEKGTAVGLRLVKP